MNRTEKRYFTSLKNKLQTIRTTSKEGKNGIPNGEVLMPMQYRYIHNLKTGILESVEGVKQVLGYSDQDFTLDNYYHYLHPDDKTMVFETTRKGFKYLHENGYIHPLQPQLSITYRIKKACGNYAHIFRQTSILEAQGHLVTKTLSLCTDITAMGLRPYVTIQIGVPKGLPFNGKKITMESGENFLKTLTCREQEVLKMVSEGKTSDEIGKILTISVHTVNTHRRNILDKTGKHNMFELLEFLRQNNIL